MIDQGSAGAVLDDIDVAELSDEDRARVLTTFLGVPSDAVAALHFVRGSADGQAPAYVFDEGSGMVYILD